MSRRGNRAGIALPLLSLLLALLGYEQAFQAVQPSGCLTGPASLRFSTRMSGSGSLKVMRTRFPAPINAIEEAASGGAVRVSAISVWEAAMLEAKGRISLSRPIDDWGAGRDPCDSEILEYSEGGHLSALNSRI